MYYNYENEFELINFLFQLYRIVPVNNASCGNKSKTEDTLNSNGISTEEVEEPSQYLQKSVSNASSQTQTHFKPGSLTDSTNNVKKPQVSVISSMFVVSSHIYLDY